MNPTTTNNARDMKKVRDRFSGHSDLYMQYRPLYPKALYDRILNHSPGRERCWDCATGNGQVARQLAQSFGEVQATDVSTNQLSRAPRLKNISYSACRAEKTPFKDNYFDLITVAQALHWFDIPAFFNEAKRVCKPEGVLAVWGYGLLNFGGPVDALISHFYREVVGPYWDGERVLIDERYNSIDFNLKELVDLGAFSIEKEMTLQTLEGYLSSWSSVQNYIRVHEVNPVGTLIEEVKSHWHKGSSKLAVFPLFGKLGKIAK